MESNKAVEYGRFVAVLYEADDGEFHVLPNVKMTVMRYPSGERFLLDEEKDQVQRLFREYLITAGVLRPDEDIGTPLLTHSTVEYFKVDMSMKNQ